MAVTSLSDFVPWDDLAVFTNPHFARISVPTDQSHRRALQISVPLSLVHLAPVGLVDVERPRELTGDRDLNFEIARAIGPRLEGNDLDA